MKALAQHIVKQSKVTMIFIVSLFVFTFLVSNSIFGATITTAGSGNWNSTTANAPWPGGTVPALNDNVIIANGHTVTLTATITKSGGTITVNAGGTLNCNASLLIAGATNPDMTISGTVNVTVANGLNRSITASDIAVTSTGVIDLSTTAATVGVRVWDFQTGSTVKLSAAGNQTLDVDFVGANIDNLILSGSGTKTLGENTTVSQLLSLEGTATYSNGASTLNYGANSCLQYLTTNVRNAGAEWITPFAATGGVIIGNTAGSVTMNAAKVFNSTAPLTINSGSTLAMSTFLLTLNGNLINNGGTTTGSGGVTITGTATQSIGSFSNTGTVSMTKTGGVATLTGNVNGGALTINGTGGTLNLGTGRTHIFTGAWTRTAGTLDGGSSILRIGGSVSGTGGTFTASTGTVDYNANGPQTAAILTYNNLTLSVAGAKTFATTPTVNGVLSLEGTATVAVTTGVVTYGTNATLQYNTTTARAATSKEWITPFVATGGVKIANTGTITLDAAKVFNSTAPLTINSGSSLAMANFLLTLNGDLINNGGTTSGSGGVTITGSATQSIGSFTNTGTVSMIKTGGVATLTGDVNGGALTINGAGGTLNLGTSRTHTFTGIVTLTNGTLNGGSSILNENATSPTAWNGNGTLFTAGTGTVNFGGVNQTLAATSTTFNNLTFSGGGTKTLGASTVVTGTLTLTNGLVTLGANNLMLSGTNAVAGSFSSTNMIVADGAGALQKSFTGAGSYIFPIGDNTSTAEYSPVTVDIASGTFSSAYIAVKVVDAKHPNASSTSYISRYWSVAQSGLSSFSATITGTYVPADIVGTFSDIISARWIDPNWVRYSAPVANTISASSLVSFGDFSGINNLPIITTSLSSLTGFTYLEGLGPSAQQSFTVSGTDLFTNITITPSNKFEVSTTSGVSFVASNLITIPVINGNIGTTTIYTRLKAGLPVSTIVPENIPCTSTGAVTKNVACSGTVTDAPLISPTVTSLTGFVYNFGAGPSIAQSFTVNGSNLLANILLSAPTDYEISLSVSSGYGTSLSLTPSSGSVSTLIYVRLKAGLLISPYVENITLTTTSGITKTVTCDGVVNSPTISVSKFNLAGFIYTFGAGPSAEQTFTTNGTNLTANLILTAPTNFQISLTSGSGFTSSISLTPDLSGNVPTTTIYVRMIAGLAVGIISPVKITATTTGGISQTIACSGQIANVATTISSNGTLNGFIYIVGNGPSIEQEFTISATSLTANVTVTPPASNFEISLTSGSGFVSSPSTLSIPQTGGKVNSVPVYVRLKSGLPVATYSTQNIVLSSTGATNVNVACNGIVVTGPTILAGPTGLESLCPNANVTLTSTSTGITNQTWTGPNGFYSTAQNPALGVVTAANNGTYTVTGSALSGVNLLTNGDFESGNTGFGSSYIFQQVAPPEKGNYWLTINPQDMYPSFCACLPHSGTLQMIVDGATSLGIVAWSQTVAVTPGEDYQFSYWIQTVFNHPNEALLQLYVNGVPIGVATNAPVYGVPWTKFIYNANSGSNSVLQLTLINKSLEPDGNDFALDDFEFQQVFPVSSSVNLTVNPTLAPSLAVSASNNPVYSGSEVVFTATPTNGGVSPTYQWYVDGALISGATGITYTYAPTNGQHVSCIMTSNYPCASPATATNEVIMVVNPLYNYWHGTISTDWGTLGNWTAGFIPAPGNDVVYATVENYGSDAVRDLVLDQDRTIGSLINKTARRLVIPPAKGLRVNNLVTIIPPATDPQTGLPTVLSNLIYIQTSSTLANGSLIFFNAVNSPVQATVEMYSKAWWDLGQIQGNRYNWQYFGIPLRSVVAEPTFYNSYVRKWYETGTTISNHWIKLENSSVLVPFYGYELVQQAPKTFYFQGTLENGNFNSGQLAITSGALYPGQHVFANPYTAAIDIRQLTFGTQTEATVYLYHCGTYNAWLSGGESAPGTSPGQYIAIPKNTAGYGQVPRQVPSMQAMLVKAMTVSAQATFAINYNSVQMYNTDLQRSKAIEDVQAIKKMSTMIDVIGAHSSDRMWIFSDSICTNSFDNGYDGFKLLGSPLTPQIFGIGADGEYQVSAVKDMNNTELGFQAGQDSEYTLTFTHENVESRYSGIYLVDLVENKTIDITASGSKYKFVSDPTASTVKRFKIVTNYYEIKEKKSEIKPIKIFNANGSVFIQNLSSESGELMIYNMSGRFVKRVNFSGNCLTIVEQNLSSGAYVATAVTNSDRFSKRIIVR